MGWEFRWALALTSGFRLGVRIALSSPRYLGVAWPSVPPINTVIDHLLFQRHIPVVTFLGNITEFYIKGYQCHITLSVFPYVCDWPVIIFRSRHPKGVKAVHQTPKQCVRTLEWRLKFCSPKQFWWVFQNAQLHKISVCLIIQFILQQPEASTFSLIFLVKKYRVFSLAMHRRGWASWHYSKVTLLVDTFQLSTNRHYCQAALAKLSQSE